jgi:hypothetical protein
MNPNSKGARCFCGARIMAYKCAICGEYFYLCAAAARAYPYGEEHMDCSCGGDGQHCRE